MTTSLFTTAAGTSRAEDERWMHEAIAQARLALGGGDWPFGAVIVGRNGQLIGKAHSTERYESDPTMHAELVAIRRACLRAGTFHITGATLFTTHEPCVMCAGAALQAHVARIVVGTRRSDRPDLFRPRCVTIEDLAADRPRSTEVVWGVCRDETLALLAHITPDTP